MGDKKPKKPKKLSGVRQRPKPSIKIIKHRGTAWYEMTSLFDGEAKQVLELEGAQRAVISGEYGEVVICLVPTSMTNRQGQVCQQILEAKLGRDVLLLSNNIQLVKLRAISNERAQYIRAGGGSGVSIFAKE